VYLVGVDDSAIVHTVAHTFFAGEYPTAPLADGNHSGFTVDVRGAAWPWRTFVTANALRR
jgi:hypothetical protein